MGVLWSVLRVILELRLEELLGLLERVLQCWRHRRMLRWWWWLLVSALAVKAAPLWALFKRPLGKSPLLLGLLRLAGHRGLAKPLQHRCQAPLLHAPRLRR